MVYLKMPVINIQYHDLINLVGKVIEKEELLEKLPLMGVSIERCEGNEISIEVFPNRPDLLSVEGMARSIRTFFGFENGITSYPLNPPRIQLTIDSSVHAVRPYVVGAVARNVIMDDDTIASLMELQEKLHISVGKNRKKMAIGVHDADRVVPPFTYKAVKPNDVRFIPLGHFEEMTLEEILIRHEKGTEYAHLLAPYDTYPLIVDAHNNVLSFPPIINGQLTALKKETSTIFIDVTGTDLTAAQTALNILSTALAERKYALEQIEIKATSDTLITPTFTPQKTMINIGYVRKILGIQSKKQIKLALNRMGHEVTINGTILTASSPAWRSDILHPIDIVEDIAIGFGYDLFKEKVPKAMTIGKSSSHDTIHQTLIGLGFNEVITLSLSNQEKEATHMGTDIRTDVVELENPISVDNVIIRPSLLPSLFEILAKNRHNDLPQSIYELGDTAVRIDYCIKSKFHRMQIDGRITLKKPRF